MSQKGQDEKPVDLASLPVEPLSELGWQRIERRLFADGAIRVAGTERRAAEASARTGRGRLVAGLAIASAAVAAAALALVLWPASGQRREGAEEGVSPPVAADRHEPARLPPSRIVTADSPSAVSVGDVALEVGARSALLVDDDRKGGILVVLERGEVVCRVAPRGDRPPLVVHAGDVRIEVIGTVFAVARFGDSARVVVHEGVVEVMRGGRAIRVKAGETWSGAGEEASAGAPSPADRKAGDVGSGRGRSPHPRPRAAGADGPVARDRESRGNETGPGGRPPIADSSRAPAPRADDKSRYEHAARLEASDPRAALAIYDELAGGSSPWAANALYAQARLEFELGHRDRARRLLESYLDRYPRGANVADARQLLDQLP